MRRYIDADLLKDKTTRVNNIWNVTTNAEGKGLDEIIDDIPTADVRENVRGEWLPHPIKGNREWDVCSACGTGCKRREYGIHANGKKWVTEYNFLFCPNCGADMRHHS